MSWIVCEGIDRSGKSTVAELYRQQGYEVVHMSAPDKKYQEDGYVGPSYVDDMLDMYMEYNDKDVVFDRSIYGEFVQSHVYGRKPLISDDDIEIFQEFEERNQTIRILMIDPDASAHWKRCVDNNEPLTSPQFRLATSLYTKLAHKYNFAPKQLSDYVNKLDKPKTENDNTTSNTNTQAPPPPIKLERKNVDATSASGTSINKATNEKGSGLDRLEKANAISAILSKRLIKQRGDTFDELEGEVTNFLKGRLEELLGSKKISAPVFADEEVQILKVFCQRLKEKEAQSAPTSINKKPVNQQPARR